MTCQKDKNTKCCYWMGMPPSNTGRTIEQSEALESKSIKRLAKRSEAVTPLTWYIRKYREQLHRAGIEVEDIPDDDWLREDPPNGPGIDLGPNFPSKLRRKTIGGKTKRRTRRKKGTKRKRRRRKRKSKRKYRKGIH